MIRRKIMNRLFVIILLMSCSSIFGGIEKYFRKDFPKSGDHSIKNIDFIYMINLDQRPEKFERSLKQLAPYKIIPCRFPAVNGWELTPQEINELGVVYQPGMPKNLLASYYPLSGKGSIHEIMHVVGRTYFSHCMPRGSIGIVLSHLSILQDAYDSGYETIWVMEDDVEVLRNPHEISRMIEKLDLLVGTKGWDVLFTDKDTRNNRGEYVSCSGFARRPNFYPSHPQKFALKMSSSPDFMYIGARYGAYSMIIRREGMKKILDFFKKYKVFLPYDIDFYTVPTIKFFTVKKDIVSTQLFAPSDNGGANYKKIKQKEK